MAEIILPPEEEQEETPQAPELNIDKPTENSKVITIEFEAKKTNKVSTKDTNQQLYTTDTDAWFEFKETTLENANGTYSAVFRNRHDGSIFQRTGDVVGGVAYYKIPHQEIRHAGKWRGQIVYTLENGNTTVREFDYDVKGHILDGKDVREIVVEDFETLMAQLNSMKDNAELELADLVNTAERNELERQQFYESLVEDTNDLQENYQELLDTGVLQTNINEKLEALEEEYAPKLTEVTAQLAQKVGDGVKAELEDLSANVLGAIDSGEGTTFNLLSEPQNRSVTYEKLDENVENDLSVMATNMIPNGNFATDTDGNGTADNFRLGGSVETQRVESNRQYWTPLLTSHDGSLVSGANALDAVQVTPGNKYYLTFESKNVGEVYFSSNIHTVTSDGRTSIIFTPTVTADRFSFRGREVGIESYVSHLMLIDLTETFGIGNEPTIAEMNKMLSKFTNRWFEGKKNLFTAKWALNEINRLDNEGVGGGGETTIIQGEQKEISLRSNNGSVTLWYDDGMESMYPVVHDTHEKYGVPGVAVIITNKIDTEGYLSLPNLTSLASSKLWLIGSHTQNHVRLSSQTEATLKTELIGAYNQLRAWDVIEEFCPFVAPAMMHDELVYRYTYLLHPYIRDFPDLLSQGVFYTKPGVKTFVNYGSYEIGLRQGKTVAQMLREIKRLVAMGYHVPVMLHGVDYSGHDYSITPEMHDELLAGIVDMNIPVVFPESAIEKHNLIYDSIIELKDETWNKDSRGGTTGFEDRESKIFFGNNSVLLGWKGVGDSPRTSPKLNVPVEPDEEYKVNWWALGDGTNTARTYAEIEFIGGSTDSPQVEQLGSHLINHSETILTTQYQHFDGTFTAPKGSQFVRVHIGVDFNGVESESNIWTWVDGITMHQANLPDYNK